MPQPVLTSFARSAVVGTILCSFSVSPTFAQAPSSDTPPARQSQKSVVANAIEEASERFHIPVAWLRLVMRAESDGDAKSLSKKGAIGLMQVMPATYAELRVRDGLGADPFDQHDNILAGAAYLAEMFERYGSSGFLAAYNAGPRRYEEYLGGRPLPFETTGYVARLAPRLGFASLPLSRSTAPIRTLASPIFFDAPAPEPAPVMLSGTAVADTWTSRKSAPHPLFPAHSGGNIFADETRSIRALDDAKAPPSVQAANLFVAVSAPGAP